MGIKSNIAWCDHTINFVMGCKKVSDGCKFCYMYRDMAKYGKNPEEVKRVSQTTINKVLKEAKPGDKVFTCSWSDFFIEQADEWRSEFWDIIRQRKDLNWLILTKRPERIKQCLPPDWGQQGWANVWLGVTIESDKYKHRLLTLHELKTTSSVFKTFVSYEPAIGWLDLANDDVITSVEFERLDWLIVGGESGNDNGDYRYRPADLKWFEDIGQQCMEANIPLFVKQMGTHLSKQLKMSNRPGDRIDDFPKHLQIQQFPL